jgi:hypothetical protein
VQAVDEVRPFVANFFSLVMTSPWRLVSDPPALSVARVVCFSINATDLIQRCAAFAL